jgi:glutamine synthetase
MHLEELIFCGTSDFSGHFRGKAFPAADLAARAIDGVGQPPTNIMLSAFGPIHGTPFGTTGELALVPDATTLVNVAFEGSPPESFCIGDLRQDRETSWECCPRDFLRRALGALQQEAGLTVRAAFEQEFYLPDLPTAGSFRLESFRQSGFLGEALLGALRTAGITPDSFVAEYAPGQFEVTVAPATGLRAADEAVMTRELIRAVAQRLGQRATLAPLLSPEGIGSGTHLHFSFAHEDGTPALFDAAREHEFSAIGQHFVAGLAAALPSICALTAPSVASYYRLQPNKWAPTEASFAVRDRGAAIRLCTAQNADPAMRARKMNLEFRVGDACASPYLAMGAVLHAGLAGIRARLTLRDLPPPEALPASLAAALDVLEASHVVRDWMGPVMQDAYVMLKRNEIAALAELSEGEICARYVASY